MAPGRRGRILAPLLAPETRPRALRAGKKRQLELEEEEEEEEEEEGLFKEAGPRLFGGERLTCDVNISVFSHGVSRCFGSSYHPSWHIQTHARIGWYVYSPVTSCPRG